MRQLNTTPVPNTILDIYLKELNNAELKVLLVIIRQTLGWADRDGKYGRKETDWISGNQLTQKTGCSKRAISSAIEVLSRKKLIEVLDDFGNVLDNPAKRQGKMRLYYRVNNYVEKPLENKDTSANLAEDLSKKIQQLVQKMQITKETLQN